MNALAKAPAATEPAHMSAETIECVVIDDSLIDRYLICHTLRETFPESVVYEFATAKAAEEFLAHRGADLILADRILPDGDGADFVGTDENAPPVLVLSGEDWNDSDRIRSEGPDARRHFEFLHKDDLNAAALAAALSTLLAPKENVVPMRPDIELAVGSVPAVMIDPLSRGLRLLRTVRSRRDRTGHDEVAELLAEIEEILVGLRRTRLN